MKLYTKPGACSTAVHIVCEWAGKPYEFEVVDAATMKSPEFRAMNPVGAVPVITDGDFTLTQNAAIMAYIADGAPESGLFGDNGRQNRAEATRWLAYVNSDVHPAFKPIFGPSLFIDDDAQFDAVKARAIRRVQSIFELADQRLGEVEWLAGFRSAADAYLYITVRWANAMKIDLSALKHLQAFKTRMDADPGVLKALGDEDLKVI